MKFKTMVLAAVSLLVGTSANVFGQGIVDTVMEGCEAEVKSYCSQVSPGEGRLLACFYAHEDKLSGRCQYALYSASAQLDQAVSALDYVATQCQSDLMTYCANVQVGEGRVAECLKSHLDEVSDPCKAAVNDVFK